MPINARRIRQFLIAISIGSCMSACIAGCHDSVKSTSVATGGPAIVENPVGPIPGVVHNVHYSVNPYRNDAVALQDGRRLFDWRPSFCSLWRCLAQFARVWIPDSGT